MKLKVILITFFIVIFSSISTNQIIKADNEGSILGKRRNQVLLSPELINNKTIMRDAKTGVKVAECMDKYNSQKIMNKKIADDDILAKADQKVACARTDEYNGACWVQSVGFVDGAYKVKVCNASGANLTAGSQNVCKTLKDGEVNGMFSAVSKNLGLEDVMYQGEYDDSPDACPTDVNDINALGYNYIEEATDPKYKGIDDFYVNYCEPLAQRFYAGQCLSSSMCPCKTKECKANGFMPDVNSSSWKSASSDVKECYRCHKTARAIRFYCQKVYNCLHSEKVAINPVIKNLTSSQNRKYLKYFYGRGNYMCGYYAGQLCGCAKTKLVGGPRHMLRIARADNINELKCDATNTLENPQCNLFDSKIYVRQFYDEKYKDTINECPRDHDAELGWQNRGTFFFPKMIVKSGEHERKVELDYHIIKHDPRYYMDTPIGTPPQYTANDTSNTYINAKNDIIIFSHFYPVVFTIGNSYMTKNEDVCETKYTNQVDFFAVRYEYNITTDTSSLVAYSITPSSSNYSITSNADGSIARFTLNKTQMSNAFSYSQDVSDKYKKVNGIVYSYDRHNSVQKQTLPNNARYYVFENIGSVVRPTLKYTYDGDTPYIVSPIKIDHDNTSLDTNIDTFATKIMIKIIPANLEPLNNKNLAHPEFEYDVNLPVSSGLNVNVAGYTDDVLSVMGDNDKNKGTNNNALLYFKRFTVDYTTSCKYLLAAQNATFDTTNPPDNYTDCDDTTKYSANQKMYCLTLSLLSQECQGYLNCLYTNSNIADCQNNERKPNIKLYGTNVDDYKINTDFRAKTYICLTNGFEFADRLNEKGNVKLYGSFGNAKYDYTVRYKRSSTSKSFLSYPTRPLTKKGRNTSVNSATEPLDDPRYFVPVYQKYFENTDENDRQNEILSLLKSYYKLSPVNNRPTDISLFDEYAGDCKNNTNLCKDRFTVSHRLIDETMGSLCIESNNLNSGTWDLKPRDFDVDYHIYVPLRCQYVAAKLYGAGGAGFTSESNTNCIIGFSTYKHEVRTYAPIGPPAIYWFTVHYRTIPKYDATGGGGGYTRGVIDINKMAVFDGYLNVSIGSSTNFVRYILDSHGSGHKCYDGTGRNEMSWGHESDTPWVVVGGSHKYWNIHYDKNSNFQEGKWDKSYMVDNDRGNTILSFNSYGLSTPPKDEIVMLASIQTEISKIKSKLDKLDFSNINKKSEQLYRYKILEYYFVALYYAIQRLSYVDKAYEILEDNVLQQCYDDLKSKCEVDDTTLEVCNNFPNNKKGLTLSQCLLYSPTVMKQNEAKYLLNLANTSYETEYNSWYVMEKTDNSSGEEIKYCEDTSKNLYTEKDNYCKEKQYANSLEQEEQEVNNLIMSIKNESYYDKIKNYIINLSSAYTTYKTQINSANEDKKQKNDSYAKNKSIDINNISFDNLSIVITSLKADFKSLYDEAYKFANDNEEISYKTKLKDLKAIYDACATDTHFNSYFPVYMALSKLVFSSNNVISLSCSLETEYCESKKAKYDTKDYSISYDDNKHNICNNINNASLYYNTHKESDGDRAILEKKISDLQTEIEEILKDTKNDIYQLYSHLIDESQYINNSNSSSGLASENTMLIKAFRGGSPIDYRIEKRTEYGPRYQNGKTNDVKNFNKTRTCAWCFDSYHSDDEYFIDDLFGKLSDFLFDVDKTKSETGRINEDFNITSSEYKLYYSDNNISNFQSQQGSGSKLSPREHIQGEGGSGWDRKYIVHADKSNCAYSVDDSKPYGGCGSGNNTKGAGNENGTFWANGARNLGFEYQSLKSELKAGSNSNDTSSTYNQWSAKHNMWQGADRVSNGGAFWHRTSTAAGGRGHAEISIGDILMEYKENATTGKMYPVMDDNGKKAFADSNSVFKQSQCLIRCPPVYVKVNLEKFLFEDYSEADLNAICEYTGTPTEDMEVTNGNVAYPNKCYIISDYIHPVYGNLKGKIIKRLGYCPIAKCKYGTWSFTELTGVANELFQYDRKAMLCKYLSSYDGINKTPWYFHMAFDSNVYASMSFKGGLGTTLVSELLENGRSYSIATCANNDATDFIEDFAFALDSSDLKLECKNGFWYSQSVKDKGSNYKLYDSEITYNTNVFTHTTHLSSDFSRAPSYNYVDKHDAERNNYYKTNNENMYAYEYLIDEIATEKQYGNAQKKISTGVEKMPSAGRELFKDRIYCPPIIDLYDFDETYSGNATWPETKERKKVEGVCKNREGDKNKYFQSRNGKPYRTCMRNGMWGPVFNSCLKGCTDKEEKDNLWSISQFGDNITPDSDNKVTVYGACSGNYLNSQNLTTATPGRTKRKCNLNSGTWEAIENDGVGCNDSLGCPADNMTESSVVVPFFKMIDVKNDIKFWYTDIINNIKYYPESYNPKEYLSYDESLYLMFENVKKECTINNNRIKCLVGKNNYINITYEIKNLAPSENNSLVLDPNGNRIIRNFENNEFIVLTIKNTFKPNAYNYMKQASDNRNAFLSMYNWIYDLKDVNKNYTGQWSWDSCNLSINSPLISFSNNTSTESQEMYKNAALVILIPKLTADQVKTEAKMVAMFSPKLAIQHYTLTNEELPSNERDILFRIPEQIPVELQLPVIDPIPMIVSTPAKNKRLYDIELKKTDISTTKQAMDSWVYQNISDNEHTPDRDCYGEYIGYIHHNTMKNIFYTPHPTSQDKYFISAFCYDGHIFGYKAFQVGFTQLTDLSEEGCFLQPTSNGENSAQTFYDYMNNKYPDAVEKDTQLHTMELNAYLAKMAGKYWANFLQPEGTLRDLFVSNYQELGSPGSSIFTDDTNIKYILEQYEKGSKGYYYRVVPRRFEWITSNDLSKDTIKVHDMLKLDDNDPYCNHCEHTDVDNLNTTINGTTWRMCEM